LRQEAAMTRALSDDLRGRVLGAVVGGLSARSAARRFGVGAATVIAWAARHRQTGEVTARRQGKPRGSRLDAHESFVLGLIEGEVDITLNEMSERLMAERGVKVGPSMLCRWLRERGWARKKDGACERAGPAGRPEAA
jgi:transposase